MTVHGVLQTQKLGSFLATNGHRFTHVFSSDLQRAYRTALAIRQAQVGLLAHSGASTSDRLPVQSLSLLREQEFGYYEGKAFSARPRDTESVGREAAGGHRKVAGFRDVESKESMARRMDEFLEKYLNPLLLASERPAEPPRTIAVVAHGLILSRLWKQLLRHLPVNSILLSRTASLKDMSNVSLEHIGGWSNTGYLELEVGPVKHALGSAKATTSASSYAPAGVPLEGLKTTIITINGKAHLNGLKRTRGVGSSQQDDSQRKLDSFFVKRRKTCNKVANSVKD